MKTSQRCLGISALATSVASIALIVGVAACAGQGARTPEELRDAYVKALRENDADAAYVLLSPELQAKIDTKHFRQRWQASASERTMVLKSHDAQKTSGTLAPAVRSGITTHEGGHSLLWTKTGDRYVVTAGLPGIPRTDSPEATIRALVAGIRASGESHVQALLAPALLEQAAAEWNTRIERILSALSEPGTIVYSRDQTRASLSYGVNGKIILERGDAGWRVIELR